MENLVELNRQKFFTIDEARNLLPLVQRITKQHSEKVQSLIQRIEALSPQNSEVLTELESEVNSEVQNWQNKMEKLGIRPKGLWVADFDSGDGYFCWKYPEEDILFWHRYSDGYTGRVPVEKYLAAQGSTAVPTEPSPDLHV